MDTYYTAVREQTVGANKRHLAVFNGVGSGKTMTVYRIKVSGTPVATAAGLKVSFGAVRMTSAPTGGTAAPWAKADTLNLDPPAEILVRAAHTGGNVETAFFGLGEANTEETVAADNGLLYEAPIDGSQPITLHEGEGFEIRQGALAGAGTISIIATIGLA